MIVLDTNVVSELARAAPDPRVVGWVERLPALDVMISAVTAAELMYDVARLPSGRRQQELQITVEGLLSEDFAGRVLPFDARAAIYYAEIVASRERAGRPISMADAQIASICRGWDAILATRNVADFADTGVDVVNPWVGAD